MNSTKITEETSAITKSDEDKKQQPPEAVEPEAVEPEAVETMEQPADVQNLGETQGPADSPRKNKVESHEQDCRWSTPA